MKPRIIIMLRYPQPGAVKTRLIPALGERRACELYRSLVRHTLDEVRQFAAWDDMAVEARVADAPDATAASQWLGASLLCREQGEGDLGQRMERAVRDAFDEGAPAVVVIGADCPQLAGQHMRSAFGRLKSEDVVLGPAADGGYYLIGLRKFLPELFRGIQWSSEAVLEQTLSAARAAGIRCELLETLGDLDRPDDLHLWARSSAGQEEGKGRISVIIPALNEARALPRTLEAAQQGGPLEIIVVDGGSMDDTQKIARGMDAVTLTAPRCRALQMNHGAAAASGEYLLFLHADTLLPADYSAHVLTLLAEPGVIAGAFAFGIADDFAGRRLVEVCANWRARHRQLPYGDQALFLRRETFVRAGCFPEIPLMEDYEFVRRLRRLGRIAIAPASVKTSGRRWLRLGMVRTTLINLAMIAGYRLGVPPVRLAVWYRRAAGGKNLPEAIAPASGPVPAK